MSTPASKSILKETKSKEEMPDPRSPSNVIQRTPITSVLKAKAGKKLTEAELLKMLDPRSPTIGINRTPMDLKNMKFLKKSDESTPTTNKSKSSKGKIEDPRSPTFGIARTPMPCISKDIKRVLSDEALFDPRSPSTDIERTPLNMPVIDDSKAESKDEEVKDNVVKKIEFSSFSDSQASSTFESASRLSLDDNSVECANLTDESINDASFVSPLPSDNCVFSTPCAKNEQNKIKVNEEDLTATKSNFTPFVCEEEVFSTPKNSVNRFAKKNDKKVLGRSPLLTLADVNSPRIKQNTVCKK